MLSLTVGDRAAAVLQALLTNRRAVAEALKSAASTAGDLDTLQALLTSLDAEGPDLPQPAPGEPLPALSPAEAASYARALQMDRGNLPWQYQRSALRRTAPVGAAELSEAVALLKRAGCSFAAAVAAGRRAAART